MTSGMADQPVSVTERRADAAEQQLSIATPEMHGISIANHSTLETVHAGKYLARFAAFTDIGNLCVRRIWSMQS